MHPTEPPAPGPDTPLPEQIMHALMQLCRLHFQLMQSVQEKVGLYPGQPQLLMFLEHYQRDHHQAPSQRELARHLRIRPATLTVTVGRMQAGGLLTRHQDPRDARIMRVDLTEKGRRVSGQFKQEMHKISGRIFDPLGVPALEELLQTLQGLNGHLISELPLKQSQEDSLP